MVISDIGFLGRRRFGQKRVETEVASIDKLDLAAMNVTAGWLWRYFGKPVVPVWTQMAEIFGIPSVPNCATP
jgi:hypothetical protein